MKQHDVASYPEKEEAKRVDLSREEEDVAVRRSREEVRQWHIDKEEAQPWLGS